MKMDAWMVMMRGKFVVFDGPDGSGKTTQFHRFGRAVEAAGVSVCEVREPGGTAIGERVREILLDRVHEEMDVRCEMLLYMASRAQLVSERIGPALKRGELVLADRFISSTLAYQGTAGGMAMEEIARVGQVAIGGCKPDLVVIFDVDAETAGHRLNPLLDRIEARGAAYHRRVREGYLAQAESDPGGHLVIDARGTEEQVYGLLCAGLSERMGGAA